jgi:methionyl-tRNA formyltransferase
MIMNDIAMIAADTSRSRVYIQSLVRNKLLPRFVLVLADKSNSILPGQFNSSDFKNNNQDVEISHDYWNEANNNLLEPIQVTLEASSVEFEQLKTTNPHDPAVIKSISDRPESTFIYSGYGGVILRKELFLTGKKFLHVHGGYLPDYKGSTTNYYSLIVDNSLGASSLFLDAEIDSGPILRRKKFPPPEDSVQIDHKYDSAARAKVLVETLQEYQNCGKFQCREDLEKGETFFIIHPILKHIAILTKN